MDLLFEEIRICQQCDVSDVILQLGLPVEFLAFNILGHILQIVFSDRTDYLMALEYGFQYGVTF
jgi:hypothetical protein